MELYNKVEAILSILPDAKFDVVDGSELVWLDSRAMPTDDAILAKYNEHKIAHETFIKKEACREHIFKYYPQDKQNSDMSDQAFWSAVFKADGYTDLDGAVVNYIRRMLNGESIDNMLAVDPYKNLTNFELGMRTLIRIGIRVNWVIDCKLELEGLS